MTVFKIINNDKTINIEFLDSDKILDIKKKIIKELNLNVKYIDLNILIETPIRGLGKFNLEKGKLPRTFDNYTLDRWNIAGKEIEISFIEIPEYDPDIKKKFVKKKIKSTNNGVYKPPQIESGETYIKDEQTFDLNSDKDFPTL
jgi:hypothetical protein